MASIYYLIDIACTPKQMYKALTEPNSLKQWWLPDVQGNSREGSLLEFRVGSTVHNRMRVIRNTPLNYLVWKCENEGDDEWKDTSISFEIIPTDSGNEVTLSFTHDGWKNKTPFFGQCSFHWARHLTMLKNLCETGKSELDISDEIKLAEDADHKWKNWDSGVINLEQKLRQFSEHWSPKIVGELNGQHVKLAKLKGDFVWHQHENEDELFLVLNGRLRILLRTGEVILNSGEFYIVPKGVEHKPVADEEVSVMLFEPISTLNTGDINNELTAKDLDRI